MTALLYTQFDTVYMNICSMSKKCMYCIRMPDKMAPDQMAPDIMAPFLQPPDKMAPAFMGAGQIGPGKKRVTKSYK